MPGSTTLFADRGYDHEVYRGRVRARGIVPAIARRGTLHGTGLGAYRWAAGNAGPTSMKRSSNSPAVSSLIDSSGH